MKFDILRLKNTKVRSCLREKLQRWIELQHCNLLMHNLKVTVTAVVVQIILDPKFKLYYCQNSYLPLLSLLLEPDSFFFFLSLGFFFSLSDTADGDLLRALKQNILIIIFTHYTTTIITIVSKHLHYAKLLGNYQ